MPNLNALGIVVSDLAETKRFYNLLGVEFGEAAGDGHTEALLPNGTRLMLDTEEVIRSFDPSWGRTDGNQLSLAFECATPAEVDEVYASVVAAGFHGAKEPWDAFWGQRYAQLRDPDGVPVDLYAANPGG
ncbi:MAG TPA: VOC family protein [Gaiellaceae bacterium]|jgi:uncharacterized glyoxalase superfamily protein PhnB|nr:VOC family protein [Gaiellaceae bacterium]